MQHGTEIQIECTGVSPSAEFIEEFAGVIASGNASSRSFADAFPSMWAAVMDATLEMSAAQIHDVICRTQGSILNVGSDMSVASTLLSKTGRVVVNIDPCANVHAKILPGSEGANDGLVAMVMTQAIENGVCDAIFLPELTLMLSSTPAPDEFTRTLVSLLSNNGTLIIAETEWEGDRLKPVIIESRIKVRDELLVTRLGLRLSPDSRFLTVNSLYSAADPEGMNLPCLEGFKIGLKSSQEIDQMLAELDLVVVDTVKVSGQSPRNRFLLYKHRPKYCLVHPFSTLDTNEEQMLTLVAGTRCTVRDRSGLEYIDGCGGLWNTHVGLGDSEIVDAITEQLMQLSYGTLFNRCANEPAIDLARLLVAIAPYPLQWVYLTGSGSESTELSMRVAVMYHLLRRSKEKRKIIYLDESYHGTFSAGMSVSGLLPLRDVLGTTKAYAESIPTPNPSKCLDADSYVKFSLECADALEVKAKSQDVAAFIVEPVLGSAGVIIPPREYFVRITEICRHHDILLILDEVATGFGRTGRWFAAEHYGLQPDILLLSKGMTSGYLPLGAVLFSAGIGETFIRNGIPMIHGSTYNGHPACCTAALANLRIIRREGLVERSAEMGAFFKQQLQSLEPFDCVKEIRAIGLMLSVVMVQRGETSSFSAQLLDIVKRLRQLGVIAYRSPIGIVFCPALVISKEEILKIVDRFREVLEEFSRPQLL